MQRYSVTDMVEYASAPAHVRELAEQWYTSRGKQGDWTELYAYVRYAYSTLVARAWECGALLPDGRALCCMERHIGWNTYAPEDKAAHDGARSMLCVLLVHDAQTAVQERC